MRPFPVPDRSARSCTSCAIFANSLSPGVVEHTTAQLVAQKDDLQSARSNSLNENSFGFDLGRPWRKLLAGEDEALPQRRVGAGPHLLVHAIHRVEIERVKRDGRIVAPPLAPLGRAAVPGEGIGALVDQDARSYVAAVRQPLRSHPHLRVDVVGRVRRRPRHEDGSSRVGYDRGIEVKGRTAQDKLAIFLDNR